MPANVTVNDLRWEFAAGNKLFLIGTIRFSGTYTTGGIALSFTDPRSPIPTPAALVKATRAPWFVVIPSIGGNMFVYNYPSTADPPVTTAMDINNGLLQIFTMAGVELAAAAPLPTTLPRGFFIFQGTE